MTSKPSGSDGDEVERVRGVYAGYLQDGRADRWAEDHAIHAERAEHLTSVLAGLTLEPNDRVLDLGCVSGDLLDDLGTDGVSHDQVVENDLHPGRIRPARYRGSEGAPHAGVALPLPDQSIDLVLAFTLFSSLTDPAVRDGVAREVGRVLRPGGALVIYDLRLPNPTNRHLRPVTRSALGRLFPGWTQNGSTLTVLPPLSRRLAPNPGRRYRRLATIAAMRSHRMTVLRPPGAAVDAGLVLEELAADPTVSVVMPVRDEAPFIARSLGAVLDQEGVEPVEIIVVDGHSRDGTPSEIARIAASRGRSVIVVDNPAGIVPVSMNLGLARCTTDVVVRVDGHCVIAPDYFRRCLDALARTGAECVGGPMATVGTTATARAIAAAQSSRLGVGGVAFRTSGEAAFVDTLAFGAYRREVFDRIGGFDEDLVRNQDDELNLRLTRAGGRIWMDPTIRSTYWSRGTLAGLGRQYHGYGFYKVRVMRKHRTVPSPRHLVPAVFVAGMVGAAITSTARRSPWPLAAAAVPYASAVATSAVLTARRTDTSPVTVAAATVTMHVAYGSGWWAGAVRELTAAGARPPACGRRSPAG